MAVPSIAWGSRFFSLLTMVSCFYGLSAISNLSSETLGYYYFIPFFLLGITLCIMMMFGIQASSTEDTKYYQVLLYAGLVAHIFAWLFIPISIAIATFYIKSESPYSITYYISSERDVAFFTILSFILISGMDHIDKSLVKCFFPSIMLVTTIVYQNYFGIFAALLIILRIMFFDITILDILRSSSQQPSPSRLFILAYSTMILLWLTCGKMVMMTDMKPVSIVSFYLPVWNSLRIK